MVKKEKILTDPIEMPNLIKVNGQNYIRVAFAGSRQELEDRKTDILRHNPRAKLKTEIAKYYIGKAPSFVTQNVVPEGHTGRIGLVYALYRGENRPNAGTGGRR